MLTYVIFLVRLYWYWSSICTDIPNIGIHSLLGTLNVNWCVGTCKDAPSDSISEPTGYCDGHCEVEKPTF